MKSAGFSKCILGHGWKLVESFIKSDTCCLLQLSLNSDVQSIQEVAEEHIYVKPEEKN